MKKKRKDPKKLNKLSVIKLVLFVFVIAIIEAAAGIFAFNQFSKRTYKQQYDTYQLEANYLAEGVNNNFSDRIVNFETEPTLPADIVAYMNENGKFNHYVFFREAGGEIIMDSGLLSDSGKTHLPEYNLSATELKLYETSGNTYIFTSARVGDTAYRIGTFADYTEIENNISALLGNVAVALIVAGLLVIFAFIFYAMLAGNRQRISGFKYRLTLDGSNGKIIRSNAKFKHEFSAVSEIKTYSMFKTKGINLVNLNSNYGGKLLALRINPMGGQTRVFADDVVNEDSYIQSTGEEDLGKDGKSTASLSKVYESFIAKGKRTLLGVMYISKLDQIKTLFGKQMALDIQRLILKKAREKFTYAYEIDFAYIGVTFPDGRKLDNLLTDLPDIHRYISTPIKMDDNLFTLDIKTGFAMCDSKMTDLSFEYAYKAAEAARQRAIDTGVAEYLVYNESQRKLYDKYFITFDIKQMLAEGAFEMEYQPQYNIKEERIEGFEALFRVKKSWNVNVDTFSFITYAERTGAMVQLGDFIFDTGMQFAKRLEGKNISVSLNVSPVQLMQAGFTENFLKIYRKYNLKPGAICVEITESFLMTNFAETLQKLAILNSNGIDVHLDDFGTEYSSLLYIKKLPIATIKIDKEFVKDVLTSKESQSIIKFITNIAKLLNHTTICEGVETPEEFDMLNYLGCDTIQGWVIGKSMKPDAALEFADTFDYKKVIEAHKAKNN